MLAYHNVRDPVTACLGSTLFTRVSHLIMQDWPPISKEYTHLNNVSSCKDIIGKMIQLKAQPVRIGVDSPVTNPGIVVWMASIVWVEPAPVLLLDCDGKAHKCLLGWQTCFKAGQDSCNAIVSVMGLCSLSDILFGIDKVCP